jgi:hypothetical protein
MRYRKWDDMVRGEGTKVTGSMRNLDLLTVAFAKRLAKGKISFMCSSGRSVMVLQWSAQPEKGEQGQITRSGAELTLGNHEAVYRNHPNQ